jgi:hypothetical protein
MPTYGWKCSHCGQKTEVIRSMADCDIGPERGHCHPESKWSRTFSVPQVNVRSPSAGGWQPFRHKTGRLDENGQPEVVEFTTRSQQEEWMRQNDMVYTCDLRDPAIGESQHSVLDQRWAAPSTCKDPDGLLKRMQAEMDFVEDPSEVDPTIVVNEPVLEESHA